jgi:heavy metal efflux system protein
MIESLVEFALKQRFLMAVLALVLIGFGVHVGLDLPVAAFPDVTNVQVTINTEARGLAAVEVEKLVSFPIESVMNGLPKIAEVRSLSKTGLSVVTVVFDDDVDVYFARNLVLERLQVAKERMPAGLAEPLIGPVTTGLGQIYRYTVEGEGASAQSLRSVNDWIVKPALRAVPGVADVLSFGGEVRQYQVRIDPFKLLEYDLTIEEVGERIRRSNRNAGGWYLEQGAEQLVIRGVGLIRGGDEGLVDLAQIIVKHEDAAPVHLRDVAEIEYGAEIRQGAVTRDGQGEVVSGIVLQLRGANTKQVIERVKHELAEVRLPPGMRLVAFYDQADLVDHAIQTVTRALGESALLIVGLLFLFLWNLRSTLVVLLSIPVSILIAFIMMERQGLSANLQSLGGLAIGIGMMVDGSIVMVENIVRHLAHARPGPGERLATVLRAAREVASPVFFAVAIIVVVFLPLFTLQGVEGKLFSPMAFTISFAMLGSLLIALFLVPALAYWLLRGRISERESFVVRWVKRSYEPLVRAAVARPARVVCVALLLLAGALALVPRLGTEFVPQLEEGTVLMRVTMNPSISLDEAVRIGSRLESAIVKHPEVSYAISSIGRAELGGDPEGVSNNEIMIGLKPEALHLRKELSRTLDLELGKVPGILLNFSQPIATRVDELLSGVKAEVAIKLFGDDLDVLARKGAEIESLVRGLRGASDVQLEQLGGETQLVIRVDRDAVARRGLNVADCMDLVSTAVGGETVGQVLDGDRRYDIYLRLDAAHRRSAGQIESLLLKTPTGARVPLAQVASILPEEGPPVVQREHARRRIVVQCNVRGRDLGGFVEESRQLLERKLASTLPPGYSIEWGGQFENQQRAQRTLSIVVPLAILMIFVLLIVAFGNARSAALILLNVPFSLIGGVVALFATGQYLSVPASIGFIAVFGVAVLNGVVLVAYIRELRSEGVPVAEAAVKGALLRIRPVLMTALVAILGLVPLLLSRGIGSEVQRPLATVVIGGIVSSTLLTLIVLPAIYRWFDGQRTEAEG